MITAFEKGVSDKIGFYVYRLIDPRNGNTFYVGKGKGDRVFAHVAGSLGSTDDEDEVSLKIKTIREIKAAKLDVIHVIHRHGMEEKTALEVEAALIDAYPGLCNEQGGFGSADRGPVNAVEINKAYSAPMINELPKGNLIIKIKQEQIDMFSSYPDPIYEAVRCFWRISEFRDEATVGRLVFAVQSGIIKSVYETEAWYPGTKENAKYFNGGISDNPSRRGFVGKKIAESSKYEGKLIPDKYRLQGMAYPVLNT
ncbi:hypothetical protein AGMMS49579_18470 [Spirochaetia bacterium]|nr:hypothetical protein AGMMS49579_18470 [Spirochaetia bacterium]